MLDPWVPRLLCQFAEESEDATLEEQSGHVMDEAREILSERGAQGVERIAAVMDDIELEEEGEIDESAAEMGGEARRDPSAFKELEWGSETVLEKPRAYAMA